MEQGVEPKALKDKPECPDSLRHYLQSFWLLSSRRNINETAQPISLSDIVSYIAVEPWFDNALFIRHIVKLDNLFLEYYSGKQKVDT